MNPLRPVTVVVSTVVVVPIWQAVGRASASAFEVTSAALVASLLSLAILEHLLLVLPLPSEKLWRWGMRSRASSAIATIEPAERPTF
jgi:putative photosynthetic complex assembly protein 2